MRREQSFRLSKRQKQNELLVAKIGMYSLIMAILAVAWVMVL